MSLRDEEVPKAERGQVTLKPIAGPWIADWLMQRVLGYIDAGISLENIAPHLVVTACAQEAAEGWRRPGPRFKFHSTSRRNRALLLA